jgi:ElaB/YqjD/DUF883 family membrane-anchored ribosome-binding protein
MDAGEDASGAEAEELRARVDEVLSDVGDSLRLARASLEEALEAVMEAIHAVDTAL